MKELTITLHPGKYEMTLRTDEGDNGITAEVLQQAMQALAQRRAQTAPPVPMELQPGEKAEVTSQPAWWAQGELEGASILFRHPGLGWIGLSMTRQDARKLAQLLQQIEDHHAEQQRQPLQ